MRPSTWPALAVLLADETLAFVQPSIARPASQHAWTRPEGLARCPGMSLAPGAARLFRPSSCFQRLATERRASSATDEYEYRGSMEDGVSLASLQNLTSDASFLETNVTKWLDDEWIPQDIHRELGRRAADIYVKAREEGITDLGQVLLNVGEGLEDMDMGDAFVDAWTVANKVSDLLLERLGREVCCPPYELSDEQEAMKDGKAAVKEVDVQEGLVPPSTNQGGMLGKDGPQLLMPEMPPDFFTLDNMVQAADRFLDEFNRFDFVRRFLEGHDRTWTEANVAMAILLGFRYDEWGNVILSDVHPRFSHLTLPPNFEGSTELRDQLESLLTEDQDEDKMKSLEEFLEVMVGKSYYHQQQRSGNTDFTCRATLVKWIYEHDFMADFATLSNVKAILEVKDRLYQRSQQDQPPKRAYY